MHQHIYRARESERRMFSHKFSGVSGRQKQWLHSIAVTKQMCATMQWIWRYEKRSNRQDRSCLSSLSSFCWLVSIVVHRHRTPTKSPENTTSIWCSAYTYSDNQVSIWEYACNYTVLLQRNITTSYKILNKSNSIQPAANNVVIPLFKPSIVHSKIRISKRQWSQTETNWISGSNQAFKIAFRLS